MTAPPESQKRVLVVVAHPDDEVLGCGGTIAKEVAQGADVKIVILQDGVTVRYDKITPEVQKELDGLYSDSQKACMALGIKENAVTFGKFPCAGLNAIPFGELRKYVTKVVQDFKPDVVYTHHHGDYNPDHNAVNEAVIFCTRPNPDEHAPRALYTFEVMSSTEWADQSHNPFQPNVFINITDTLEQKLKAMQLYKGEVRDYPHPRSLDALRAVAQVRAIQSGIKPADGKMGYAEAFHLVREVQK